MQIKIVKKLGSKSYSHELKVQICEEYLTSDISLEKLTTKYQIGGNSTIYRWLRKMNYISHTGEILWKKIENFEEKPETPMQTNNFPKSDSTNAEQEVERLRAELAQMKEILAQKELKIYVLEKFKTVVKRDFGIDAEKKPSTKRSGK